MTLVDGFMWLPWIAAFVVGLSKGGLPSIGMLAVPILALVMSPVKAAVLLLPIYLISDVVGVSLYRRKFSKPNLIVLIPAGILGVLIGWATATMISDQAIALLIGLLGIGFCLKTWFYKSKNQKAKAADPIKGLFWGTAAGFTSFISHAGAPPYQIYMLPQKLSKIEFAGTTVIVFAMINLAKVVPYQNIRPYSFDDVQITIILIPFALAGTFAGAFLTRRIKETWFFLGVQISLFVVSVKLVVSAVMAA
jgi:uncharacterized membrane protein YfcA